MTSILLLLAGVVPTARAADVLYCVDYVLGTDALADALSASGHTVTTTDDMEGTCETEIATSGYDLVVVAIQDSSYTMPNYAARMAAGLPTIVQDWNIAGDTGVAAAYGVTVQSVNESTISGFDSAISSGLPASIGLTNPGWGSYSFSSTASGAISLASFEDGNPAILALGMVVLNGFLTDTADPSQHADMVQLYSNEIDSLTFTDADGDGFYAEVDDCDDSDGAVNPDAADTWYDGTDSDCGGNSDYDQDGDGDDYDLFGGTDCDDLDSAVNVSATETYYDGTDANCDGWSDYDQDGDGDDSDLFGGTDCVDTDAAINPLATETWYDGTDGDCSGGSDFDQDGDGEDGDSFGGDDCDDTDAAVNTSAVQVPDGRDNNCNGTVDELGPDTDGDGVIDADELDIGTDPVDRDTDDDGLSDGAEYNVYFCDPLVQDTDGDGIGDATEVGRDYATIHTVGTYFVPDADTSTTTDPNDADTDDDGITDSNEDTDRDGAVANDETDPVLWDTDADGLLDGTEIGLTSAQTPDTNTDDFIADADPTTTTDPLDADSDGGSVVDGTEDFNHDGAVDGAECDPNDGSDDGNCLDNDFDGLSDVVEAALGTDPLDADSDDDGLEDGIEVFTETDPLNNDTDGDGLLDGTEDANRNGETDAGETDPRLLDTDGGSVADGDELDRGTDPLNPADDVLDVPDPDSGEKKFAYVGGACSSAGSASALGASLFGLAVVMRRRRS